MIRIGMLRVISNRSVKVFSISMFVLLLSCLVFGQGGVATGDLHVTVKDPKGSLVTNATVTVSDVEKGLARTATGDGQGGYSARQLPPGIYSATVEAAGFGKLEVRDVSITVGGTQELPVALAIASGKELVEVSSQVDLVETSRTSTTDTIGQRRIDNLPINGRNYINFTLTDSQVRPLEPGERGWRRRHGQFDERRTVDRIARGGAGISDHHQQLRAGVRARGRRCGEYHHTLGIERFSRGRLWLFAQPKLSGGEPV